MHHIHHCLHKYYNDIVVLFIECDRGGLEDPRNEQEENEIVETEHQCDDADHNSPSLCITLALIVSIFFSELLSYIDMKIYIITRRNSWRIELLA